MIRIPYTVKEIYYGSVYYYTVDSYKSCLQWFKYEDGEYSGDADFSFDSTNDEENICCHHSKLNEFHMSNLFLWGCKQL